MTPDALRNRARAWLMSLPRHWDAAELDSLTAELLAIRNEALGEAARECAQVQLEHNMPGGDMSAAYVAVECITRVRALSTAGRK